MDPLESAPLIALSAQHEGSPTSKRRFWVRTCVAGVLCFLAMCAFQAVLRSIGTVRGEFRLGSPVAHLRGEDLLALTREGIRVRNAGTTPVQCPSAPPIPFGEVSVVTVPTLSGDRNFAVFVPTSYATKRKSSDAAAPGYTPAPVIFVVHGLGDSCDSFLVNTGFREWAEQDAVIVVAPCGSAGWLGVAWNAGMCCGFTGDKPDELAFFMQVLDAMDQSQTSASAVYKARNGGGASPAASVTTTATAIGEKLNLCVNTDKIMMAGFSNGAMLGEVFGCKAPDIFRAVASIGGITEPRPGGTKGLDLCTEMVRDSNLHGARPSVLMVHGDADVKVPWDGSYWFSFPTMPENIAGWVQRNGCDPSKAKSTIDTEHFVNSIYPDCAASPNATRQSMVEIVRVIGGEHRWPERDGFSTTGHSYNFGASVFRGWD